MKLRIYETEEDAKTAHYNRICPKCGGIMKHATTPWCSKCMDERHEKRIAFINEHTFYSPKYDLFYRVEYTDELTKEWDKGHHGKHFTMQRKDTMEIIHTDNLWSWCSSTMDTEAFPKIEFM